MKILSSYIQVLPFHKQLKTKSMHSFKFLPLPINKQFKEKFIIVFKFFPMPTTFCICNSCNAKFKYTT